MPESSKFPFPLRPRESPNLRFQPLPPGSTPWGSSSLLLRRKFYVGISAPARSPLAPSACIRIFPHPCSDLRWVSRSPHFAKVGQNFPFHAAHLVSPISGDPPFRGNAPKVSDPGYLSRLVSCCVVWASVLPLSDCPPRSHLRKFSSPSYPLENVALRLLEKESLGPTLWSLAPQPRIHDFFLFAGGHAITSDWLPPYNRGPRIRHPT